MPRSRESGLAGSVCDEPRRASLGFRRLAVSTGLPASGAQPRRRKSCGGQSTWAAHRTVDSRAEQDRRAGGSDRAMGFMNGHASGLSGLRPAQRALKRPRDVSGFGAYGTPWSPRPATLPLRMAAVCLASQTCFQGHVPRSDVENGYRCLFQLFDSCGDLGSRSAFEEFVDPPKSLPNAPRRPKIQAASPSPPPVPLIL